MFNAKPIKPISQERCPECGHTVDVYPERITGNGNSETPAVCRNAKCETNEQHSNRFFN